MLGGVLFKLVDGRTVAPLYEAPWLSEQSSGAEGTLLDHLRSEFVCLPYGARYSRQSCENPAWDKVLDRASVGAANDSADHDHPIHGYSASGIWTLVERLRDGLTIAIDYPENSAVRRITRTITSDPLSAALNFSVSVEVRRACRLPFGLHPIFSLPDQPFGFKIRPGQFTHGFTHPLGASSNRSRAARGETFSQLDKVPVIEGGFASFEALPLPYDTEELLLLGGSDGKATMVDEVSKVTYSIIWDSDLLPSLHLWISNRGRKEPPWNGRNLCVGIEPTASAFELGVGISNSDNPISETGIATTVLFSPGRPVVCSYRIQAVTTDG
jgi:hypothetical protein